MVVKKKIQTLEDMLRAYALNYADSWDISLPLVEFACNSSYHASIGMAPFQAFIDDVIGCLFVGMRSGKENHPK